MAAQHSDVLCAKVSVWGVRIGGMESNMTNEIF